MKPDIPRDPEQRWEWIKYQIRSRGMTMTALAASLGVTHKAMGNAKYGPYPRMERGIAKLLEMTPQQIWPERWNADGTPARQRPNRSESSPRVRLANRKDSGSNARAQRIAGEEV